jgi:hypothetical protein
VSVPVPLLLAVAVKVTGVAAHTGPAGLTASVNVGLRFGFTAIVIVLDAAVLDVKQFPPLILIAQETIVPLVSVEDV